MRKAPEGAIYVVSSFWATGYAEELARFIGRDDLEIVHTGALEDRSLAGKEPTTIIVDHCVRLTPRQLDGLSWARLQHKVQYEPETQAA